MTRSDVSVKIWGCRGSLPCSGPETRRYGGETSCYEIRSGGHRIVVDCGSGLRKLGERMMREGAPERLDVLLTHPHLDHVMGLGMFAPLIGQQTDVRLWTALPRQAIQAALERLYTPPLWPVRIPGDFALPVCDLPRGTPGFGPFEVTSFPLNHPGGAAGFRIRTAGRTVCVVTDHEHGDAGIDAGVQEMAAGADLMLYDAAYSGEEYRKRIGWGHSSWPEACRLAAAAGVARTYIIHHNPGATDAELDAGRTQLRASAADIEFAWDGLEIAL